MRFKKRKTTILLFLVFIIQGNTLLSQTVLGIETISSTTTSGAGATANDYTDFAPSDAGGSIAADQEYEMRFGRGNNLFVTSYTVSGIAEVFNRFVKPDTLVIRRVDAGTQLVIFYEYDNVNNTPPRTIDIDPDIVLNEEALYRSDLLNAGYDNILVNNSTNFANVERIDILWYTGILTSTPGNAVVPVLDRGGNDDFKIAAITSLDANGDPSGYSTVVDISASDFITTTPTIPHQSLVMRRQDISSNPLPQTTLGSQDIQGIAVTFTELGISANQVIYGYSIFADDVTGTGANLVDFTNQTFFPRNTSASGLDLVAGISTAVANDDNLRRSVGPGGFKSDLDTWLKANVLDSTGTTTTNGANVVRWDDKWTGNNDAVNALGTAGTFLDGSGSGLEDINFNATVDFVDAVERGLEIPDSDDFNTAASYERKSINIVFRTGNNVTAKQQIFEQGGATRGLNLYIRAGSLYAGAWNQNASDGPGDDWNFDAVSTSSITTDTEYIVTLEFSGNTGKTGTYTMYLNGENIGNISGIGILYAHGDNNGLGDTNNASLYDDGTSAAASFYGSIPELIYCNEPSAFSTIGRRKIESYLALKYGITLDQSVATNYIDSEGTTIFDAGTAASVGGFLEYNNDIAGIGRDDDSEFVQTTSQSENAGSLVRIARTTDIGNNTNWLIWGNDAGALTETTLNTPDTIVNRLTRIWRASETGQIGVTDVSFDITDLGLGTNPSTFSLLIAGSGTSGNFSSAEVITGGTTSVIDSRTFITFSNANIDHQEYFTLGTEFFTCGPGGVETNLQLWLRADKQAFNVANTTLATDGQDVVQWQDQSIEENDATSTFTGNASALDPPAFTANGTNFNPHIAFSNTDDNYLAIPDDGNVGSGLNPEEQAIFVGGSISTASDIFSAFIAKTQNYNWQEGWAMYENGTDLAYHKDDSNDGTTNVPGVAFTSGQTAIYLAYSDATNNAIGINLAAPNTTVINTRAQTTQPVTIGAVINGGNNGVRQFLEGTIGDVILYDNQLTPTQRQRVASYLAIKYGITIDQGSATNYLAADEGPIWNASDNSGFNNDIAGIGRDDRSCLLQLQSKSVNPNSIVTMGLGEIAATNASNPNTFASDDAFLIWGNDGASATQANNVAYTEGIITERMLRIWRVDENASTVGNTDISFDLTGLGYTGSLSDYNLIISDAAGLTSPTIVAASSLISDVVTFSDINLTDGQYFTLGTDRTNCGPGGISTPSLTLWLKADDGAKNGGGLVTNGNIDEWENATSNASFAQITTGDQDPNKVQAGINYNPYIEFNGTNEDLVLDNVDADVLFSNQDNTAFFAFNQVTGGAGVVIGGWESDGGGGERLAYYEKAGSTLRNDFIGGTNMVGSENIADRFVVATTLSDATNRTLFINGLQDAQEAAASFTAAGNTGDFALGSRPGPSNYTASQAGELIIFNDNLSPVDIRKVETYLAIKYGTTQNNSAGGEAGDYRGSDNTLLWDASANATYHNDVAGIGRDDASCFVQKQAASSDGDDILAIGLGTIAADNAANPNAFAADGDYLIWGNDDGSTSSGSAVTTGLPVVIAQRMERIWRVDETGTVGNTEIQFELSGTGFPTVSAEDYRLMIAGAGSGGSMSAATLVAGGTFNGTTLSFSNINLADGEYFTLGIAERCGPGGVNDTSLALWLKADEEVFNDAGTTPATDGQDVIQWNDQSSNTRNGEEADLGGATPSEPTLEASTINYNPSILFSDPNTTNASYINTTNGNNVSGDMTLISVFNTAQSQGSSGDFVNTPALIGANGGGTNDYGLGVFQGQVVFNAENNNGFNATSPLNYNDGATHIATATRVQAASGAVNLFMNSDNVVSANNSDNTALTSPNSFGIGNHSTADLQAQFQGEVAETIVFSKVLSADERTRVESYLAIKYGLTRSVADGDVGTGFDSRDYRNSDGTVVWDYDARTSTYYNDLAGIGRDDNSCFEQLRSKSESDDAIVDVQIGSFASNNQFFLWGNDNAQLERPRNDERPSGINSRLNREWQAQETNAVGNVTVTFDLSAVTGLPDGSNNDLSQIRLMRDTNDDFSDGVTLTAPTSFSNGLKTVTFTVDFEGGTGFYFTLGSIEENALPIELINFEAQLLGGETLLQWATASETNNAQFIIERSNNGEIFEQIGTVNGAGNSSEIRSYQYLDKFTTNGLNFYRLKQVDFDGQFAYSPIVVVDAVLTPKLNLKIHPNPIEKYETLQIEIAGLQQSIGNLNIIDSFGRIVKDILITKGSKRIGIDVYDLASGIYFIRLSKGNQSTTERLIVR